MVVEPLPLNGPALIKLSPHADARGRFTRVYCSEALLGTGFKTVAQANHSLTAKKGTVRGMHYQRPPKAEGKLIHCIRGRVFDVYVDLRAASPSFLQWHGIELSAGGAQMVYIPQGFAHGFQVLEPDSELLYFHDAFYSLEHEGGLNPLDPRLNISWPLPAAGLSKRDQGHPYISDSFAGLDI